MRVEDVELGGRSVNTTAMQWHPTQRVLAMGRADGVATLQLASSSSFETLPQNRP